MSTWSKDELRKIAGADDLHVSPFRVEVKVPVNRRLIRSRPVAASSASSTNR